MLLVCGKLVARVWTVFAHVATYSHEYQVVLTYDHNWLQKIVTAQWGTGVGSQVETTGGKSGELTMMWGSQPAAPVEGGQYMSIDITGGCLAHAYICYLGTTGM